METDVACVPAAFSRMRRVALAGGMALGTIIGSVATGLGGQGATDATPREDQGKKGKDRLAKTWPGAQALRERQLAAENLPLFGAAGPLAFTLASDFKALSRDRKVASPKRFPGVLTVAGERGQTVAIPVQVSTRGKLRLNPRVCSFTPLRVEFSKKEAKGTAFENQGSLKLVTHCRDTGEYEQYVLGESLAYRIANVLTPASFRIRVGRATYVDSTRGKTLTTRWATFIEDQDDVARRMQGRIAHLEKRLFRNLDEPSLLRLAVFQVLIGNTDYSIHALHNTRLIQDPQGVLRPIAYDFDVSGLVNAPYAAPDPRLRISSVRDRRYRGPCLPVEQLEPTLAEFRAKKAEILALYDAEAGVTKSHRDAAKDYLTDFFDIIANERRTKLLFVDRCRLSAGM